MFKRSVSSHNESFIILYSVTSKGNGHLNLNDGHTWFGCFPCKCSQGSSKRLIQRVLFDSLKNTHVTRLRGRQDYFNFIPSDRWHPHTRFFLTGIAADVEGWGSAGGGPGEAGRMVLRVGLTVFLIHVATVELWLLTPSAAVLTESIRSPEEYLHLTNGGKYCIIDSSTPSKVFFPLWNNVKKITLTHSRLFYR